MNKAACCFQNVMKIKQGMFVGNNENLHAIIHGQDQQIADQQLLHSKFEKNY